MLLRGNGSPGISEGEAMGAAKHPKTDKQAPPRKMTHFQVSIVLKLRNSDLELKASVKKREKELPWRSSG